MSEPTNDGEFVCCNLFRPCYGPTCKHHADNLPATPSGAAQWDISEPRNPATPVGEPYRSGELRATPSGETKWCGYCAKDRMPNTPCVCATPSPEAREVPREVVVRVETRRGIGWYSNGETIVCITPADAKRIVALAQEAE